MIKVGKNVKDVMVLYNENSLDCRMAVTVLETTLKKAYPNKRIHTIDVGITAIPDSVDDSQVYFIGETDQEFPENYLVFTKGLKAERAFSLKPNYRSAVKKFGVDYNYTHKVVDEILDRGAEDICSHGLFGKVGYSCCTYSDVPDKDDYHEYASREEDKLYGESECRVANSSDNTYAYDGVEVATERLDAWYLDKLEGIQAISASESMTLLEELADMKSLPFALGCISEALSSQDKILMDGKMIQDLREYRAYKLNLLRSFIGSSFVDEFTVDCEGYKFLCINSSKFDKDILRIVDQEILSKSNEDIANFESSNPLYPVKDIDAIIIVNHAEGKCNVMTRLNKSDKEILDTYVRGVLDTNPDKTLMSDLSK